MLSNHLNRMRFTLLLLFAIGTLSLYGQESELPTRFNSPYEAIYNHLQYLQEESHNPKQAAKSLFRGKRTPVQLKALAIELKQILDGSGNFIRLEEVPTNRDYTDSTTNKNRYILVDEFKDIYVQKYGDHWLFSERTVSEIDHIHKQVYPYGTDKLLNLLPKLGNNRYLGLYLWQYLGILILVTLGFLVNLVLKYFIRTILVNFMHRYGKVSLARDVLIPAAKPFSLMIVAEISKILIPTLQLPVYITSALILIASALVPLFATIFFYKLVDVLGMYFEKVAGRTTNTLDDQLAPLVRKY